MKKYLFLIAATCALLSCAKEGFQESTAPDYVLSDNGANGKIISFSVEVEPSSETKATISSSTNFTWGASDRAAVYTSDGTTKVELTPSEIEGGKATFTGEVPSGKTVDEGAIVVYPASFLTGPSSITFPDSYDDAAETKGQGTVLAAKVASGKNLSFKYLAATLRASITDVPSIATSITVTSTQTLTGVHTIDFTGSTPSLSPSSTAKVITFSSPANGNNVLIIPVPKTGVEQEFTYNVNYSSGVLFTKSTSKTLARNTYLSMTPLTINPDVYLIADFTDWSYASSKLMGESGTTRSATLLARENEYYRYLVDYGSVKIDMGPTSNGSTSKDEVLTNVTNASKMDAYGMYDFSFDYVTANNKVTASASPITIFLTGTFQSPTSWQLNNDTPMSMLNNDEGVLVKQFTNGTEYKAYTNAFWRAAIPSSDESSKIIIGDTHYYLIISDAKDRTLENYYTKDSGFFSSVCIPGSFNDWDTTAEMKRLDENAPVWYYDVVSDGSDFTFKFFVTGSWWNGWAPDYCGNNITHTTDGSVNNKISGTAGTYRIIAAQHYNDNNDGLYWAIFKKTL